jgi:hypothetical protein
MDWTRLGRRGQFVYIYAVRRRQALRAVLLSGQFIKKFGQFWKKFGQFHKNIDAVFSPRVYRNEN